MELACGGGTGHGAAAAGHGDGAEWRRALWDDGAATSHHKISLGG